MILQASREKQNLQDDLSKSGTAVQLYAEGRATSPPEDQENGEIVAQYLVAIHLPDNFDPSAATEAMEHDIDVRLPV